MLFKNGVLLNSVAAAFFGLLVMPVFAQPCLSNSCSSAFALTTNNLVSFEVATSRDVANNEVNAYLVENTTAKTAKELANKINPIINQSLAIAKKYPSVVVATGSQNAYPSYDKGPVTGLMALQL